MDVIHRDTVSIRLQRGDGDVVKQFPDEQTRILALYAWLGSGEGPLSGFPSYEMVAEELLLYSQTEAPIETAKVKKNCPATGRRCQTVWRLDFPATPIERLGTSASEPQAVPARR